jgi:hypothetical protein
VKRGRLIAAVLASPALLAACHREEPGICRTSPPDDPTLYQRWADDVTAAHCKGMRIDQSAVARPTKEATKHKSVKKPE